MKNLITFGLLVFVSGAFAQNTSSHYQDGKQVLEHATCQIAVGSLSGSEEPFNRELAAALIQKGYYPYMVSRSNRESSRNAVEQKLSAHDLYLDIKSGSYRNRSPRLRILKGELFQAKNRLEFSRASYRDFSRVDFVAPQIVSDIKVPWPRFKNRGLISGFSRHLKVYRKASVELVKSFPDCRSLSTGNLYAHNYTPTAREVELNACLRTYRTFLDHAQNKRRRRTQSGVRKIENFGILVATAHLAVFPPLGILGIVYAVERAGLIKTPWAYEKKVEDIIEGYSIVYQALMCHRAELNGESCDHQSTGLLQRLSKKNSKQLKKLIKRSGGLTNFSERLTSHLVADQTCSAVAAKNRRLNIKQSLQEVKSGL